MATGAAAVVVTGALVKTYSDIESAKAQEAQMQAQADAKEAQAAETLRRAQINAKADFFDGKQLQSEQVGAFAGAGVGVGAGTSLTVLEETATFVVDKINKDLEAAMYGSLILQNSALSDRQSAKDIRKAGNIRAVGSLMQAAGSFA